MSDPKKLPRPPQVSLSGWVTIVASVFVIFNAFSVVGNLRTIENRERLTETLARPMFRDMGITLEQAIQYTHVAALVAGAAAAATMILGWFVLQGHRQARVALSIVVFPLVLSGMITGDLLSPMIAVCAALVWTKPARDWFNGVPAAQAERQAERRTPPPPPAIGGTDGDSADQAPKAPAVTGDRPSDEPRPYQGFGTPGASGRAPEEQPSVGQAPVAQAQWPHPSPYGQQYAAAPAPVRPPEVLRACLVTWLIAGLVGFMSLISLLGLAVYPDAVREMVEEMIEQEQRLVDSGFTASDFRAVALVLTVLVTLWALTAVVLAIFATLGHNWARILLICSAVSTGLLCLVSAFSAPPLLVVLVAAAYTVYALTVRPVGEWYRERSRLRQVR